MVEVVSVMVNLYFDFNKSLKQKYNFIDYHMEFYMKFIVIYKIKSTCSWLSSVEWKQLIILLPIRQDTNVIAECQCKFIALVGTGRYGMGLVQNGMVPYQHVGSHKMAYKRLKTVFAWKKPKDTRCKTTS